MKQASRFICEITTTVLLMPVAANAYNLMPDQNFDQGVGTSVADISGITVLQNGTSTPSVIAGNLTYPNLALGSGNSVSLLANASSFVIPFTPANFAENPGEYNNTWFSLLVKVGSSGTLSRVGSTFVSIVRDGTDIAGFAMRDNGSGGINFGATRSGVATQWNTEVVAYGTTTFLVGAYSWETPFGRPGGLHAYAYSQQHASDFVSSNGPGGPYIGMFWIYSYSDSLQPNGIEINSSATTDLTVDAVRIGTIGGNVAPVPEPSTYALLLFGGAASLTFLKRARASDSLHFTSKAVESTKGNDGHRYPSA